MSKHLRIAFCGLGSIGKRHLRNLSEILKERAENFSIDWIKSGKKEIPDEFKGKIQNVYSYEDELDSDYDIIFVTNPTNFHHETIAKYQWKTKALFIEKPLFDDCKKMLDTINEKCIYYIACPVRYKSVIQYVKNEIRQQDVLSAIAVCSSYLPEWRKGTDYTKEYSAIKSMGGGVSLDLIHELDYLKYIFGEVKEVYNIRTQISPLILDSDDVSVYIAKIGDTVSTVYLDYFGRKDIRSLTLFCKEDTVQVDLLGNTVSYLKSKKEISFEEKRDDFQKRELMYFLDILDGKCENTNDMGKAYETLKNSFGRI